MLGSRLRNHPLLHLAFLPVSDCDRDELGKVVLRAKAFRVFAKAPNRSHRFVLVAELDLGQNLREILHCLDATNVSDQQ